MLHYRGQWLSPEDSKLCCLLNPHSVESFGLRSKRLQFLLFIRSKTILCFEFLAERAQPLLLLLRTVDCTQQASFFGLQTRSRVAGLHGQHPVGEICQLRGRHLRNNLHQLIWRYGHL